MDKSRYIDKAELYLFLEVPSNCKTLLRSLYTNWGLESINIDNKKVFNRYMVERIKDEAVLYFEERLTRKQVISIIGEWNFRKNIVKPETIDKKFSRMLTYSKNTGLPRTLYKRKDIIEKFNKTEEDIEKVISSLEDEVKESQYIFKDDAMMMLELQHTSSIALSTISKDLNIDIVKIGTAVCMERKALDIAIDKVKHFYESHYSIAELKKMLTPKEFEEMKQMCKPASDNAYFKYFKKTYNTNNSKIFYLKSNVDEYIQNKKSLFVKDEWLSIDEARLELNLSLIAWKEYVVEYGLKSKVYKGKTYFKKIDIDELLLNRKNFYEEYIDFARCKDKYFGGTLKTKVSNKIPKHKAPLYALDRSNTSSYNTVGGVFKISEVEEYLRNLQLSKSLKINNDIYMDTNYDTFIARLDDYKLWAGFEKGSVYTEKRWFLFVRDYLDNTIKKGRDLSATINKYVICTKILKDMISANSKQEVYELSSSEINMSIRGIEAYVNAKVIYLFIRDVYMDVEKIKSSKRRGFKISDIVNPDDIWESRELADGEIYGFEVYSEFFKHCTNKGLHIKRSLQEIDSCNRITYASSWLYMMLHLNNAWRHGDVRDFPEINLVDVMKRYGINDYKWFEENDVTLELARVVLYRINQWEFTMSKNQMKGNFFCSDELAPSFATAALLCSLYKRLEFNQTEVLMNFHNKYNEITDSMIKKFINGVNLKNFKFLSRKFNKTVMTYLYYIANLSGDTKSLTYAMKLRGHANENTTAGYVELDDKAINSLCEQLFERGEFGYIPSMLIQKINGGALCFEDVTKQVKAVKESFGDIVKVNYTIGFINSMRTDATNLSNKISDMSLSKAQETLTDIFAKKLPSKMGSSIQCLCSKTGCVRDNLESCFECQYHIPTIYALTTLSDELNKDLVRFNKAKHLPNKFKIANSIEKKKFVLLQAIKKFGHEYVYSSLGMTREQFLDKLMVIPKPSELVSNIY